MEKIKNRIIRSEDVGILHDSRKDVRTLDKAVNMLIDKLNDLIEDHNELKEKIRSNQQHENR